MKKKVLLGILSMMLFLLPISIVISTPAGPPVEVPPVETPPIDVPRRP